jgi:uncharacterized protein YggU (UPF0235/DUF167 family)
LAQGKPSKSILAPGKTSSLANLAILSKLSLLAPPTDGRANQACIEFFATLLKAPRSSVTIASGQGSRNKVVRVAGLSVEEVRERIAI